MKILGISAYFHDSAAALLQDGRIVAATQEERFSRKKHDSSFPQNAVKYCLNHAGISLNDLNYICFYDKPVTKFNRLITTYISFAPRGFQAFLQAMPIWFGKKLFLKNTLQRELANLADIENKILPPILFNQHHRSHAASAFYPSPYKSIWKQLWKYSNFQNDFLENKIQFSVSIDWKRVQSCQKHCYINTVIGFLFRTCLPGWLVEPIARAWR